MRNRLVTIVVVAVGLLIVSVPMTAHHSSVAFDTDTEITLKGTVTEWIWSNPHCLLRFDVSDENGQVVSWIAETQNPRNMSNRGWASTVLQARGSNYRHGEPSREWQTTRTPLAGGAP